MKELSDSATDVIPRSQRYPISSSAEGVSGWFGRARGDRGSETRVEGQGRYPEPESSDSTGASTSTSALSWLKPVYKSAPSVEPTLVPSTSASSAISSVSSTASQTIGSEVVELVTHLRRNPIELALISAGGGTGLTLLLLFGYRRYWRRIRNADGVPQRILEEKRWVKGIVTSVGDGDNFRLYHTPGPFWRWPMRLRRVPTSPRDLKDQTISIRIAGVDAPEAAHFGKPAQPHSRESLDWLRETLLKPDRKLVKCQFLRRDQYGRIVAVPLICRSPWTAAFLRPIPLPLEMLRHGMAVVYESGGAEYGPWGVDKMKAIEAEAKSAKRGLWSLSNFESPADYKRRHKIGESDSTAEESGSLASKAGGAVARGLWGWIAHWFRR